MIKAVAGTIFNYPSPTYSKFLEAQHIHYTYRREGYLEEVRTLIHNSTNQQSAVRSTLQGKFRRRGIFFLDQIFSSPNAIIKHILLIE